MMWFGQWTRKCGLGFLSSIIHSAIPTRAGTISLQQRQTFVMATFQAPISIRPVILP